MEEVEEVVEEDDSFLAFPLLPFPVTPTSGFVVGVDSVK